RAAQYSCCATAQGAVAGIKKHEMRLASKVISFLFHPMLMAIIGMYLILNIGPLSSILGADGKRLIYLIVFFSTAVLPVSLLPLFYQFGVIKSFQMESSRERVVPV